MFNLSLKEKWVSPEKLILQFGLMFRVFFLSIAGFILYAILTDTDKNASNMGPGIFVTICIILGTYYEAWIFDKNSDTIIKRQGFLFLFFSKRLKISSIEQIVIKQFVKGGAHKSIATVTDLNENKMFQKVVCKLSLDFIEGDCFDIEVVTSRDLNSIIAKGEAIAKVSGKSLIIE